MGTGICRVPIPFLNFQDKQSDAQKKDKFSLTADPEVVESIVNIKNVVGLTEAVKMALKKSGGKLADYQGSERHFNYFGVVTAYNETNIAVRVIKFALNLKETDVTALCVHYTQTKLDSTYDTYQFVADKELMIKMQAKIGEKVVEYIAAKLLKFVETFYDKALADYRSGLTATLKGP